MTNSVRINIFMLICLGILLYILFAEKCGRSITQPTIIKGKDVERIINLTVAEKQALDDSFNLILNKAYLQNDKNYTAYIEALNKNSELLRNNRILSMPVPDTCKEIVSAWVKREYDLKTLSDNKDVAAKKTINGLQGTVYTQQRFLASKDTMFNRLKKISDTCAKALTALEQYSKKIKPKHELNIGLVAISPYTEIKPQVGILLGYRGKTGTQFNVGYYSNKQISIGLSKTLFRF